MSQMHTLELPEPTYEALIAAAQARGTTPANWIAERLTQSSPNTNDHDRVTANQRLRQHMVSLGRATGVDNAGIDADLARELDDDHGSTGESLSDHAA